jgi:hypothetical protein
VCGEKGSRRGSVRHSKGTSDFNTNKQHPCFEKDQTDQEFTSLHGHKVYFGKIKRNVMFAPFM